jgi:hypothetical protein
MRPRRLQEVPKGHLMKGAARAAVTVQPGAICQNRVVIHSCAPPRLPADADDFLNEVLVRRLDRGSQVRSGLAAGGIGIRILGPPQEGQDKRRECQILRKKSGAAG